VTAENKDFKVKHGLQVAEAAYVGGNLAVSEVSDSSHAASLGYLNLLTVEVSATAPSSIFSGKLWLDTTESRLKFYHNNAWVTIASKADTEQVVDHIHDYAIDGTGRIIEVLD
jgi:hypothetical protein